MAIGGDQGGSIRIPASHVGIVGLKPTFGLVPYTGIVSNEISVDHTGPMTRDVMSNAELLHIIAGVDGIDDRQIAGTPFPGEVPNYPALLSAARSAHALLSAPIPATKTGDLPGDTRKIRIGILKEGDEIVNMDPRVAACVRAAAKRFEELGAEVVEVSVPEHLQGLLIGRVHRLTTSNNLLGRASGTRQLYLNDLTEKILPWTQEKFEKLFGVSAVYLLQGIYADEHYPHVRQTQ
ncbi:amidase signature enzyme [Panus rudis PR-1116 ss-1]|nr:amidase signature enzyme [Panus rudis PR-1116 ss-1]